MPPPTDRDIRYIFLTPRPNVALMTAADLLGMTLKELKADIEDGAIVAVPTALGMRLSKEELIALAMEKWDQGVIEAALGEDKASVMPHAIRLVELRARVPRYQRDVLRELARRDGTSVDAVPTRELEGVASAQCGGVSGGASGSCLGAGMAGLVDAGYLNHLSRGHLKETCVP